MQLARAVRRELEGREEATCVDHVRAFAERARKRGAKVLVVHGLVADCDAQRAFPHVWARLLSPEGTVDLDPTLDLPVDPATHRELIAVPHGDASGAAGRAWLELFAREATSPAEE